MVNELQKLHKIISSFEEQASEISEFNGVLRAVNEARTEIVASKATLSSLAIKHEQLIEESYDKFDNLEKRLSELEKKLADLAKGQDRLQSAISELKILSPDQFERGQDKILLKLTDFNFLTPAQYEEGQRATIEALSQAVNELTRNFEQSSLTHQASLKSLKAMTFLGLIGLAGVITYLGFSLLH